ncbi:MAG: ABC transporter substrate-binding protein [Rhizobiaceae bacterium]
MKHISLALVLSGIVAFAHAGQANAQQPQKIRVASAWAGLWDTSQPAFCQQRGEFAKAGLDVEVTFVPGASVTALASHAADIAYSPSTATVLGAFRQGAKLKIISAQFRGQNDTFFYVPSDSPIKTVADLKDKTIGFPRPGGPSENILIGLEAEQHLGFKRMATGPADATYTLVMTRQIDVGYGIPPALLGKVEEGQLRVLFTGDIVKSQRETTSRVVAATDEFLTKHRDAATTFMRVLDQCIDWAYANKPEAVKAYAEMNKIDAKTAEKALQFYDRSALAFGPLSGFDQIVSEAIAAKFIDKPVSESEQRQVIDILYTTPAK